VKGNTGADPLPVAIVAEDEDDALVFAVQFVKQFNVLQRHPVARLVLRHAQSFERFQRQVAEIPVIVTGEFADFPFRFVREGGAQVFENHLFAVSDQAHEEAKHIRQAVEGAIGQGSHGIDKWVRDVEEQRLHR